MKGSTAAGRRRKPSAGARLRRFWMPLLLGALVVAGIAVAAGTWSGFEVRNVQVAGNHRVTSDEILKHASIARHGSIWFQSTGAIARRIEAIPYVATAAIHRVPPDSLRINVTERTPYAVLESGFEAAIVDRDLRVLAAATGLEPQPVFVVKPGLTFAPGTFVAAHDALALRDAYDAARSRNIAPLSLSFDRYGGLVMTLSGGVRLLLGQQSDLARKLTLVDAILSQVVQRQRRVATIDLRAPGTPVVVYR